MDDSNSEFKIQNSEIVFLKLGGSLITYKKSR